jgi:ketosteroid isomerase-like protein
MRSVSKAFDRGTYRWKAVPRSGGDAIEDHGKYPVILQRQPGGSWKVARDMDNSDRPLAQSARGAS